MRASGGTAEMRQKHCAMLYRICLFFILKFSASVPRKVEQKSTYLYSKQQMHFWNEEEERCLLQENCNKLNTKQAK